MLPVISFGEAIVDLISDRQTKDLKSAEFFRRMPGGAPANVAVGVARLGGKASFLGKLGSDSMGDFLLQTLQDEGVNVSTCVQDGSSKTMLAMVWIGEGGERDFEFFGEPGAHNALKWDELPSGLFKKPGIFHFGSLTLIHSPIRSVCLKALAVARENHFLISFDPNLRLALWDSEHSARKMVLEMLPMVDILKLSEDELDFLADGETREEKVDFLKGEGVRAVFITHGARGSEVYFGNEQSFETAIKVDPIDTTGAGDGFMAGILRGISFWESLDPLEEKCNRQRLLSMANHVAGLVTSAPGAMTALPAGEAVPAIDQFFSS